MHREIKALNSFSVFDILDQNQTLARIQCPFRRDPWGWGWGERNDAKDWSEAISNEVMAGCCTVIHRPAKKRHECVYVRTIVFSLKSIIQRSTLSFHRLGVWSIALHYRFITLHYRFIASHYRFITLHCRFIASRHRVITLHYRVIASRYRVITLQYSFIASYSCVITSHYPVITLSHFSS